MKINQLATVAIAIAPMMASGFVTPSGISNSVKISPIGTMTSTFSPLPVKSSNPATSLWAEAEAAEPEKEATLGKKSL